ncbi:MAG: methyl-accepting chemotaxis protein [Chitinispirillales bacterium]|jgi:methyl-accepting chemotaxis protein|nr:methyl-accepting chemotaxis protein [Chitinispirillales bacterium]
MKNLRVSAKLLLGFGIAVAFTLIVGLVSMVELERLNKDYTDAIDVFVAENAKAGMEFNVEALNKSEENGIAVYKRSLATTAAILVFSVGFSIFLGLYVSGLISKPLHAVVNMITEMGKGHLSGRLRLDRKDEIGVVVGTMDKFAEDLQVMLIGTLNRISDGELAMELPNKDDKDELGAALRRIVHPLRELIIEDGGRVLRAAAQKDLSLRLKGKYKGDFAKMKNNINAVMENLDDALIHVAATAGQVSNASVEIAKESQNLAQGSNEQAISLEEAASNLEEMSVVTKQNAGNTNRAKVLASEARAAAGEGDVEMQRMIAAINQIKQSSDNTAKIVKTINDIAFQTSLLSLNAAVEAARAGEAGNGFAVVAGEVRSLAQRSAEAAKNTAAMIGESVKSADSGVKITEAVATSLTKIVNRTEKVGVLIDDIAAASNEQARDIERVNGAVALMSRITQQNAANSDESAYTAQELSDRAAELASLVGNFKLSGEAGRYYANRSAAEVWVDIAPADNEEPILPAVSTAPAALSAHKRRQRRRKRMEAHRAEKAYKHKRQLRAAAHHSVRADKRKRRSSSKSARAVQAREVVVLKENGYKEIMINA